MADNSIDSRQKALEYFRLNVEKTKSLKSMANLRRAFDSFVSFVGDADLSFDAIDETILGEWIAFQYYQGYYTSTISYNVKKLGELYNKGVVAGIAKKTSVFSTLQKKLGDPTVKRFDGGLDFSAFKKIRSIVDAKPKDHRFQLARDILLFAIFNGGLTFEQIAGFKKDDYSGSNTQIKTIVNKYFKPRNKYLFPLNQAHSTPRQQHHMLTCLFEYVLAPIGVKNITSEITLDLWCRCAMSCGIRPSEIAACTGNRQNENSITSFVKIADMDAAAREDILNKVIWELTYNPLRWFAMRLRPHTGFDQVMNRLSNSGITLGDVYYPMQEIVRKVGTKKVFESQPIISWLLFFRTQLTEVDNIFRNTRDLAWIYRQSSEVGSPYSVVSDRQIQDYKLATGSLGADSEFLSDEAVEINDGDYVIVLGGIIDGRPGIVQQVKSAGYKGDAPRTICTVRLCNGQNINWVISKPSNLLQKITSEQFFRLQ